VSVQRFILATAAALTLACAGVAGAQSNADLAPDVLARNITDEVLQVLRADKDIQSGNMKKAIALVETKVLPHFDFTRMTQLAMGRNWRDTTPEQKKALTQEFRDLLVRTYTVALTQYRNQTVDYKPLKLNPGETEVVVRSQINNPGAAPISVDYAMSKAPNGWKVFDIAVENVSLVQNYRTTFNTEVQKSGVDGLIKVLADRNKALAARQ
jgi:phospholipid transport system substrate-binding protein